MAALGAAVLLAFGRPFLAHFGCSDRSDNPLMKNHDAGPGEAWQRHNDEVLAEYGALSAEFAMLRKHGGPDEEEMLWQFLQKLPGSLNGHAIQLQDLRNSVARAIADHAARRIVPARQAEYFVELLRRGDPGNGAKWVLASPEYEVGSAGAYLVAGSAPATLAEALGDSDEKVLFPVLRALELRYKGGISGNPLSPGETRSLLPLVVKLLRHSDGRIQFQALSTAQELASSPQEAIGILREFLSLPNRYDGARELAKTSLRVFESNGRDAPPHIPP
jgi:hypothetical protein